MQLWRSSKVCRSSEEVQNNWWRKSWTPGDPAGDFPGENHLLKLGIKIWDEDTVLSFCDHWTSGSTLEKHLGDITPLSPHPAGNCNPGHRKENNQKGKWEGVPLTWIPLLPLVREGTEVGPSCEQGQQGQQWLTTYQSLLLCRWSIPFPQKKNRAGRRPEKQKININMCVLALGLQNSELTKCLNGSGALLVPSPMLSSPLLVDRRGGRGKEIGNNSTKIRFII